MENNKSEFSEIIGDVSKFVGAMVGSAVVITKRIEHCLRNMMTGEVRRGGSGQVAAKPIRHRRTDEEVGPASEALVSAKAEAVAGPILEAEVEEATAQEDTTQPQGKKKMKAKGKKEGEGKVREDSIGEAKIKKKTKKAKKSTPPRD